MLFSNRLHCVHWKKVLCFLPRHFKLIHFGAAIMIPWNYYIFLIDYHTVRISYQPTTSVDSCFINVSVSKLFRVISPTWIFLIILHKEEKQSSLFNNKICSCWCLCVCVLVCVCVCLHAFLSFAHENAEGICHVKLSVRSKWKGKRIGE